MLQLFTQILFYFFTESSIYFASRAIRQHLFISKYVSLSVEQYLYHILRFIITVNSATKLRYIMKLEMDIGSSSKLPIDMDFQHVFDLEMTKKMFNFGGKSTLILNFTAPCDYSNSGHAAQQTKAKPIAPHILTPNFSDINCFTMR